MKIYKLKIFYEDGNRNRAYKGPKDFYRLHEHMPPLFWRDLFMYKYLKLHPNKYADYELELLERNSSTRLDVEDMGEGGLWCASERFKEFSDKEQLGFDFFPVKVEKERRYLMAWRNLPVLTDYEVDTKKSRFYIGNLSGLLDYSGVVFRSDIIEYLGHQIFCDTTYTYRFVVDYLKEKLEKQGFLFSYEVMPVTEKNLNVKKVEKVMVEGRKRERELYLIDGNKQKFQDVDDCLEKVLIEEGDKEILDKFRNEMKGEWKKNFERYEKGLLEPMERIKYW